MSTFLFPDVNVWVALSTDAHPHNDLAQAWSHSIQPGSVVFFCRQTQLGLLRILTNRSAMGEGVLTQAAAWSAYDRICSKNRVVLLQEPLTFEETLRSQTNREEFSTKHWAHGYLAAFAIVAALTLVTFDKALAKSVSGSILLGATTH